MKLFSEILEEYLSLRESDRDSELAECEPISRRMHRAEQMRKLLGEMDAIVKRVNRVERTVCHCACCESNK